MVMSESGLLTQERLGQVLDDLLPGRWQYRPVTGSTNDDALQAARGGAPDGSLFLADQQTAGRGRGNSRWHTPPASALALSWLLRPTPAEAEHFSRFSGLAAVALQHALLEFGITTAIKWPNDLLWNSRKVAGILIEAIWQGHHLEAVVLGIGVNVLPASLPPTHELRFPAACLAEALQPPPERPALLRSIVRQLLHWRPQLATAKFLAAWEAALAWKGHLVQINGLQGRLLGLTEAGYLRLDTRHGERQIPQAAGHLRPLEM